jgi:DNA-binding CsgD family transcriptional regulator
VLTLDSIAELRENRTVAAIGISPPIGREAEWTRLLEFVGGLADGPSAATIRGDPGIGKTVLLRAAAAAADRAGGRVLLARCAEAEMPLPLVGLGDLVDRRLLEVAEDLPEPQRHALAVAAGLESVRNERPEQLALPRAFTSYLRALAQQGRTLIAIDDVQWLDAASARLLAFAVRRLHGLPCSFLITLRAEASDELGFASALGDRATEIHLGPLDVEALHHVVRQRLGARIARPALARIHAASAGNPMFALELARLGAGRAGAPAAPLPVPSSLEALVRERVAMYAPRIRTFLAVAAAIERPTVGLLEAVLGSGAGLVDEAVEEGAIVVGDDGDVRFTHPLLASAAYAAVPPTRRRRLHAALAECADDAAERARHLALSSVVPSRKVAQALDEAASHLRARGAPDAAADLAKHAARLTPDGDAFDREERVLAVAEYLLEAGQVDASAGVMDELLATGLSGTRRSRALWLRAVVETSGERARRLAEEALEHVGDDRWLEARLLLYLATYVDQSSVAEAEKLVRRALAAAEELCEPQLIAAALAALGRRAALQARPEPKLVERAIRLTSTYGPLRLRDPSPTTEIAEQRLWSGDLDGARALLESELKALRDRGIYYGRKQLLRDLADLEWRAGNWNRAAHHLDEHWQLTFDGGDEFYAFVVQWQRALLAASQGLVDEADQLTRGAIARAEGWHWPSLAIPVRWVRGFLALSRGEPAVAYDVLHGLPRLLDELEIYEPGYWPLMPDVIEACVAVGDLEEADRLLSTLDARARALNHRWGIPAALRCRALLLLAHGDADGALATADEAAAGFEAAGFRLDRGRALLLAGETRRRRGERRRAGERLDAARDVFSTLGAPIWVARVESELRRARPRPRLDQALTSAERRVATLVAAGSTNREVAAQLFTTVGTVEVHLTRIYRKIGVRSRTELARRVAEGTVELAGDEEALADNRENQ